MSICSTIRICNNCKRAYLVNPGLPTICPHCRKFGYKSQKSWTDASSLILDSFKRKK